MLLKKVEDFVFVSLVLNRGKRNLYAFKIRVFVSSCLDNYFSEWIQHSFLALSLYLSRLIHIGQSMQPPPIIKEFSELKKTLTLINSFETLYWAVETDKPTTI